MIDPKEARRLLDAHANAELVSRITTEEMAQAWCRYTARNIQVGGSLDWTADEDGWAAELRFESEFSENESLLRAFIAALVDAAPDDEVLGAVGAGPLEDFMAEEPDRLAWVEAQAARSERFRVALGSVWIRSWASDETIRRVETAAGVTLG